MWLNWLKTAQSYEKVSKMQNKKCFSLHFRTKVTSARQKLRIILQKQAIFK